MTLIYGQIESLKKIRETLDQKGISRFNSVRDINEFIRDFETKKEELFFKIENEFDLELDTLQVKGYELHKIYDNSKKGLVRSLNKRRKHLDAKCNLILLSQAKNSFEEIGDWFKLNFYKGYRFIVVRSYNFIIEIKTYKKNKILKSTLEKINHYSKNRQSLISDRCTPRFEDLVYAKTVARDLNPLIAGAIGENLVKKELEKLSDDFVLLNDFSLDFNPPIYNRNNNDRIFSIQIDHLLITHSGIFILETKNWSKKSIKNLDLRSPVQQIKRTNYALFVILSNASEHNNLGLNNHHWGEKQIPLRNVVVMINEKPNEKFKYVKIKRLNELNNYINYFDPIFTQSEIKRISEYLRNINN